MVREIETGRSYRDVARDAKCSPGAVHRIFQRWKNDKILDKLPRSGRPRKLTVKETRYVLVSLQRDRRITYEALVNRLGGKISRST
jgi:transposase